MDQTQGSDGRFVPLDDPRPEDVHWPVAVWPPSPGIHLRGTWVELTPTTLQDFAPRFRAAYEAAAPATAGA